MTPLDYAGINNRLDCVKLLLKHGCDPNHISRDGNTSLHFVMIMYRPEEAELSLRVVQQLLLYGANGQAANCEAVTPLDALEEELEDYDQDATLDWQSVQSLRRILKTDVKMVVTLLSTKLFPTRSAFGTHLSVDLIRMVLETSGHYYPRV